MIAKIIRFISDLLMNLKLRQKFLIAYLFLLLIPLILFSLLSYSQFSNMLEDYVLFSAQKSYSLANSYISDKLDKVRSVILIVLQDKNTVEVLSKSSDNYDIPEQISDMNSLTSFLSTMEDRTFIKRVGLYIDDNLPYSSENINLFKMQDMKNSEAVNKLFNGRSSMLWGTSEYFGPTPVKSPNNAKENERYLSAISILKNPNNFLEPAGFVRVDIEEKTIKDIISKANTLEKSLTYIQNSEGKIITSSDSTLLARYKIDDSLVYSAPGTHSDWPTALINDTMVFFTSSPLENTGWYMVTVMPYEEIFSESMKIRDRILFLVIITIIIAYLFASYISYTITKRISHIIKRMKDVHNGVFRSIVKYSNKDEVGELIDNYNYMIERISTLVEEQYRSGQELKNAELKALQAQINPHFLYNTLDMISWLAQKNATAEVETAVITLAKFYKLSLNSGRELVSIREELLHVFNYVKIQNMRYSNKIQLIMDVSEEIKNFSMLKITLQPIVENSIMHGILGKAEKKGTIHISAYNKNDQIVILVHDDGIGISKSDLDKIKSNEISSKSGSGFGIRNVKERIKLFYGDQYGLSCFSETGKGTTVEIRISVLHGIEALYH